MTVEGYKQCSQCVLDTNDDPKITFDFNGICNYCNQYKEFSENNPFLSNTNKKQAELDSILSKIKRNKKGNKYDSILGVSGGCDSTYLAYQAKQLGLNPLIVHFDNGWNTEIAVMNIENIVKNLDLDLYTYVVNWDEFKDIQLAFFKASVIDIELITDQAIVAVLFNIAEEYNIKYILYGSNLSTEAILPENWYHWKIDVLNIEAIHKMFGKLKMKTYPKVGFFKMLYHNAVLKTQNINLLDYMPYVKEDAKKIIKEKIGWRDYGGKHHESIFTRFYQAYILPSKFHVDKRKAHLSTLICTKQITKQEALEELKKTLYDPERLKEDTEYVIKKFGLTQEEFDKIMALPIKSHLDYPSYFNKHYKYQSYISKIIKPLKKFIGRK